MPITKKSHKFNDYNKKTNYYAKKRTITSPMLLILKKFSTKRGFNTWRRVSKISKPRYFLSFI